MEILLRRSFGFSLEIKIWLNRVKFTEFISRLNRVLRIDLEKNLRGASVTNKCAEEFSYSHTVMEYCLDELGYIQVRHLDKI